MSTDKQETSGNEIYAAVDTKSDLQHAMDKIGQLGFTVGEQRQMMAQMETRITELQEEVRKSKKDHVDHLNRITEEGLTLSVSRDKIQVEKEAKEYFMDVLLEIEELVEESGFRDNYKVSEVLRIIKEIPSDIRKK